MVKTMVSGSFTKKKKKTTLQTLPVGYVNIVCVRSHVCVHIFKLAIIFTDSKNMGAFSFALNI